MAEHYTQGRQGQGSRRRRNHNNQGRNRRHRMPRPEAAPEKKKSFLQRLMNFFGFGKKKDTKKTKEPRKQVPQNVRVAKGASKQNNQGGNPAARGSKRRATSVPPTRNARLYVGNLSYEATESELEDLFKGFGHVRSVEIIYNTRTYKSKGYAFVEMVRMEDACKAAEVLHGQPFMGRELMVSAASERQEKETRDEAPETAAETPAAVETAPEAPAEESAAAEAAEAPATEAPAEAPAETPAEEKAEEAPQA